MLKQYYGEYDTTIHSFQANEIDAVVGFFMSRGYEQTAAITISSQVLIQAKNENVNVFTILDKFKNIDEAFLEQVINEIVNKNRQKTSVVGFRKTSVNSSTEDRNIIF